MPARRICDRRMVTLATGAPSYIEILWNEGNWALGSMPLTSDAEQLDVALDTVRRFADLLRVLPPSVDPQDVPDPRDPHGPAREELADEKTDGLRDKARRERQEAPVPPPAEPRRRAPRYDDLPDVPSRPEPPRPPAPPRAEVPRPETGRPDGPRPPRPTPFGGARPGRDRLDPPDLPPISGPYDRD